MTCPVPLGGLIWTSLFDDIRKHYASLCLWKISTNQNQIKSLIFVDFNFNVRNSNGTVFLNDAKLKEFFIIVDFVVNDKISIETKFGWFSELISEQKTKQKFTEGARCLSWMSKLLAK
jgi:hypothetical protein